MRNLSSRRTAATFASVILLLFTAYISSSYATSFRVLHRFCSACDEGDSPAELIIDTAGNLFGVAIQGGDINDCPLTQEGCGTVFELSPSGSRWTYRVLHTFCSLADCVDGGAPVGSLVIDENGNLYGVTSGAGNGGAGTVYELKHGDGDTWTFSVLYAFCSGGGGCPDGSKPVAGLSYRNAATGALYDGRSALFGSTLIGGAAGKGTVFEITTPNDQPTETVLYNFCSKTNCTDGANPGAVVADNKDNLYGTTSLGGKRSGGEVFVLRHQSKLSVLYSFCSMQSCADGDYPSAGVTLDSTGNIFGTAGGGGAFNRGTLYALMPSGTGYNFSLLHSFCQSEGCIDGEMPIGGVGLSSAGAIFGTASQGGKFGDGALFTWNGAYSILHNFCKKTNCTDGIFPAGKLVLSPSGTFYGTAELGGKSGGGGVVFGLAP